MELLFLNMPGGTEWLLILAIIFIVIPFVAYRIGYNSGKKAGELEAYRRRDPNQP